jgi:anti-sigma regulatory factor (Ser/Thr protein kinase)
VTAGTVTHSLSADFSAVREARTLVQQVLGNWRAHRICDDVALVASELVANALRHGLHVERSHIGLSGRATTSTIEPGVHISLVSTGSMVICSVTDPSGHPPVRRLADPMESSGRGLQLVESLSLCWGWTVLDGEDEGVDQPAGADGRDGSTGTAGGKSVWAVFPVAAAPDKRARRHVVGAA